MGTGIDIGVFGARGIPSTYGGYETFLTALLPELADRGHRVTAYCRADRATLAGSYRGVTRVSLPAIETKQLSTLSHGLISAVRARVARHDVLLVVNVANAPFCALARWTGQPVVLNTDGQEWLRGKWGRAGRWFFKACGSAARYCANALVADCAAMADVYRKEFRATSTVIPYFYSPRQRRDTSVLDRLKLEDSGYFVVAGRLVPENNADRIAEAYTRTSRSEPLAVLGTANYDSPIQRSLEATARRDPRLRLFGHMDNRDEFLELLARAKGYIHGHSVGGMNPALVEAMGVGAFILAFDTPFNREALGGTGRLFTMDGLASAIDEVAKLDPSVALAQRAAAHQRAEQEYGVDDIVTAYEALLVDTAAVRAWQTLSRPTCWGA